MKQTRSIRLFFILTAVCLLVFFWLGFRFGRQIQQSEDRIQMARLQQTEDQNTDTDSGLPATETMNEKTAADEIQQHTGQQEASLDAEAGTQEEDEAEVPKFYLKQAGEYLTVYVSATDQVYFETDIPAADLPTDLQADVKEGIDFFNLEHLYSFLENYAS